MSDRRFKAREIASQIGVDEGAVSTALSRLKDREPVNRSIEDVVFHCGEYAKRISHYRSNHYVKYDLL